MLKTQQDFQQRDLEYPNESPINPITPEFQQRLYQRLHETATPDLAKSLFLAHYAPYDDIDVSVVIHPEHGFLGFSGGIHACSSFEVDGRFTKDIGGTEYVLHGSKRHRCEGYEDSGGLFFKGDSEHLEPEMIVVEKPQIRFVFGSGVPAGTRRRLGAELLRFIPFFQGGVGEGRYSGTGKGWKPAGPVNRMACEYQSEESVDEILQGLNAIRQGFDIQPAESGIYVLTRR